MIRITALLRNCFHGQISYRRSAGASQKQPICKPGRRKRRSKNEPVLMVYRVPCFFDIIVLCQIGFFIFETAEPSLNHDIIGPTAFSIHTLTDSVLFDEIYIPLAGKLTSLIGIQNPRFCDFECFFQGCNHHSGIQGIINFPAYNTAAVPINDSRQVQISTTDWNISNINRPSLIWFIYNHITEQIRTYLRLLHPLGQIHFRINWMDVHFIHVTACFPAPDVIPPKL